MNIGDASCAREMCFEVLEKTPAVSLSDNFADQLFERGRDRSERVKPPRAVKMKTVSPLS